MSKLKDVELKSILPTSISEDENVRKTADAVSNELTAVTTLIPNVLVYSHIDQLPENLLDLLAWQFHVEDYDDSADIDIKRKQVKTAIAVHRYKGTVYAVKVVVEALAGGAKVREWYEYGGNPYHFRVEQMPDKVRCGGSVEAFTRAIENAKNVRSWLDELRWQRELKVRKRYAIAAGVSKEITIGLPKINNVDVLQPNRFATAAFLFKEIWIGGKNG